MSKPTSTSPSQIPCNISTPHSKNIEYSLSPAFLRSANTISSKLYPVSDNELAFLVLRYLKENKFRKSYEAFVTESGKLTSSLHSYYQNSTALHHTKPKTLWAIISEYLGLHEEKQSRIRLFNLESKNNSQQGSSENGNHNTNHPNGFTSNPLGNKMKETFEKLSDMIADYHVLRESVVQQNLEPQTKEREKTQIPFISSHFPLLPPKNKKENLQSESSIISTVNSNEVDTNPQSSDSFPVPSENVTIPSFNNNTKTSNSEFSLNKRY